MNDEAELAGVLAHEVSHVIANDGVEAVKHAKFAEAASPFVKQYGQQFGAFSKAVDDGADFLFVKGFSQDQERKADSKAVELMILANYDPRGLAQFLDRANNNAPHGGSAFTRTHP